MKIERVDERTVKCFLSNEELEEYDIDYKDFVLRSDKAKEVVQEIIEQAEEEVGYKPPRFAFDLQIVMLPEQGLILTFSERDSQVKEGEQFIECLREMRRLLQKTRERLGGPPAEESEESAGSQNALEGQGAQNTEESAQNTGAPQEQGAQGAGQEGAEQAQRPGFAAFVFSGLGRVMEFAAALPGNLQTESSLYEMDGFYYLYLLKGRASYERYSRACIQALEFGSLYAAEESQVLGLKEHGKCLIPKKAVKKLRG